MFILTVRTPLQSGNVYSRWWWALGLLVAAILIYSLVSMGHSGRQRLGPGSDQGEGGRSGEEAEEERGTRPPS